MLKNSIVYDNNIVNICFKVEEKKDNGKMRAKRVENFRSRGGPKSRWGWTQNFGDGGDRSPWGGDNPLMGLGPPHTGKPWRFLERLGWFPKFLSSEVSPKLE